MRKIGALKRQCLGGLSRPESMAIEDIKPGMHCHLAPTGSVVFVVTEISDPPYSIGIGYVGQTKTQWYFQPWDVLPVALPGHTHN